MSPASNIELYPDQENDILYVLRKSADKRTINKDLMPQLVLRIDPKTDEVVGLIIHNFSKVFSAEFANLNEWARMEIFDFFLNALNAEEKAHPTSA